MNFLLTSLNQVTNTVDQFFIKYLYNHIIMKYYSQCYDTNKNKNRSHTTLLFYMLFIFLKDSKNTMFYQ